MTKDALDHSVPYKPVAPQKRFWFSTESAYTERELDFRRTILGFRAHSGIHADYLTNPSTWFAEDSHALININENSWVFPNAYKPRASISMDDFHVQPLDSLRLQWPMIYSLMQNIGDYLITRNRLAPAEHLNQPMNFILLDLINIFKGLAQSTNIQQLRNQLDLVNKYIRKIEKNVLASANSDKLFLADLRVHIDEKIEPSIVQQIEAQLLHQRLTDLSKTISSLSNERNRILHFALNKGLVNPHPYEFSSEKNGEINSSPTQVARNCAQNSAAMVVENTQIIKLTAAEIKQCKGLQLINYNEEILTQYAAAISDLHELDRFQRVVWQIIDLLNQAGEVYTIHQFKNQMVSLLQEIDLFLDSSSKPIQTILRYNSVAYHLAIQMEQDLPIWRRLITNEREDLKQFIKNQDNLELVSSRPSDLITTVQKLKEHVAQVVAHLNKPKIKMTTFQSLSGQAQELNQLMLSMHAWIKIQHDLKGLAAPQSPEPLLLIDNQDAPAKTASQMTPYIHQNNNSFFAMEYSSGRFEKQVKLPTIESNHMFFIMGLVSFPIAFVALYLVYRGMKAVLKENSHEKVITIRCT